MTISESYVDAAEECVQRILALIPTNPQILTIDSPWLLFKIPEFKVADLALTAFQAGWALREAQVRYAAHR